MIPNIHIHEQLMFERVQERLREREQQCLLTRLRKPRYGSIRHIVGSLNLFFVALGTSMKQLGV